MNRSWKGISNNSPGFVYFNNSQQSPNDTPDFLSFNNHSPLHNSPKYNQNFTPPYSSSPKCHKSPYKFNLRNTYRHSGGYHGNRSFSNNSSSSFGSEHSFRGKNKHKKRQHHRDGNKKDMSRFLDPSCTKDPWEELEKAEREKKTAEKECEDSVSNIEEENSSSDSEESDDLEKSSNSTIEEST